MEKLIAFKDVNNNLRLINMEPIDALDYVNYPQLLIDELKAQKIPLPKTPVLCLIRHR